MATSLTTGDGRTAPPPAPTTATATLGSFRAVDAAPAVTDLVAALDDQAARPAVQRLRAAAIEQLEPRFGDRLADVGCGTGDQARALASLVGPHGSVLGIDPSRTMLDEARRRTPPGGRIEYRLGDAEHLEVDDASLDGVRCERVFQHLAEPAAALSELVRVTRPGGCIVVIDSDWGMHAIHGADPDLTARVVACWAGQTAHGWIGRQLPALFAAHGMPGATVLAETFTSRDPGRVHLPPFTLMAAAAWRTGAVTRAEADSWSDQLVQAGTRGAFFWAVTMFAVAGRRPA
jgi:ubiquinone/menaquinone biosynthesis C-methylase UbiE